jgi:hypothetical protein
MPASFDQLVEPKIPQPRTAAKSNVCLVRTSLMAISLVVVSSRGDQLSFIVGSRLDLDQWRRDRSPDGAIGPAPRTTSVRQQTLP